MCVQRRGASQCLHALLIARGSNSMSFAHNRVCASFEGASPRSCSRRARDLRSSHCRRAMQVSFVRTHFGPAVPILFTPNFCHVSEYSLAYEYGAEVTVDGPDIIRHAPEVSPGSRACPLSPCW